MSSVAEKGQVKIKYVTGFASLADAIASDEDHSSVIFKRFDRLAARNLLYLQSELNELEALQEQYDREDFKVANSHDDQQEWLEIRQHARDWTTFKDKAQQLAGNDRWQKRMELAMKIRTTLKEYREAMINESTLLALRNPSTQAHHTIRSVFDNEHLMRPLPTLSGASINTYNGLKSSFVALGRNQEEDRLTIFLRTYCSFLFSRTSSSSHAGMHYFSAGRISMVVNFVTVLLASAFLFGAINHLYHVHRDQTKLGWIAGYTIAFAGTIGLITNARRAEIFAACAAYAAVLVVFVSGNLTSDGNSNGSTSAR